MKVVYITNSALSVSSDPLLRKLREIEPMDLVVLQASKENLFELVQQVATEPGQLIVVIDTFLSPDAESVKNGRWRPTDKELHELVGWGTEKLTSLLLVWMIHQVVGSRARILVTSRDVGMDRRLEMALEIAFKVSRGYCLLYGWDDTKRNSMRNENLVASLTAAVFR